MCVWQKSGCPLLPSRSPSGGGMPPLPPPTPRQSSALSGRQFSNVTAVTLTPKPYTIAIATAVTLFLIAGYRLTYRNRLKHFRRYCLSISFLLLGLIWLSCNLLTFIHLHNFLYVNSVVFCYPFMC